MGLIVSVPPPVPPPRDGLWWIADDPKQTRPRPSRSAILGKFPRWPRDVGWPATCSCLGPGEERDTMSFRWNRGMQLLGAVAVLGAAVTGAACGGGGNSGGYSADAGPVSSGGDAGNLTKDGGNLLGNTPNLLTISVTPATAAIE